MIGAKLDRLAAILRIVVGAAVFATVVIIAAGRAGAQVVVPRDAQVPSGTTETSPTIEAPSSVEVRPVARDEEIALRLRRILQSTGWFADVEVRVDEGVVFLHGSTGDASYKKWAGDLARNTRDVVAVINQMMVTSASVWDFRAAVVGLRDLRNGAVYWAPFFLVGLVILGVTYFASSLTTRGLRSIFKRRIRVALLSEVLARGAGFLVFLLGLYIVLKISGLTRLALTVLGGTGLFGLVLGIAFRDIAENFLASILLSVQSPFRKGDLVDLAGVLGVVEQLNVRTTVLMSLTGHHVQLPNALVYKSIIRNYSSNPNRREDFTVGIGYDASIPEAQALALKLLDEHPAVLKTPEPWVLVDSLGAATVVLRVYFWLDGSQFSWLKVRSSIIRLTKRTFQDHGISMPDEAREVVFPQGISVRTSDDDPTVSATDASARDRAAPVAAACDEQPSVPAEGNLKTESEQLREQAAQARPLDAGENLLDSD